MRRTAEPCGYIALLAPSANRRYRSLPMADGAAIGESIRSATSVSLGSAAGAAVPILAESPALCELPKLQDGDRTLISVVLRAEIGILSPALFKVLITV